MNCEKLQALIIEQKKKNDTLILAHTYQSPEILAVADEAGDSYALAKAAEKYSNKRVLVCGVRFMAETVKILSPEKEVILPEPSATCPMAEQISPERVREFKKENPDYAVVAYINTTAALKAECDVCVTSSSALRIVGALKNKNILFIPDKNLGSYVKSKMPDKNIVLWDGCCPVHNSITAGDAQKAKQEHPQAVLAVHPECPSEVLEYVDYIGATSGIIDFAVKSDKPVIIGTEGGVYDSLILKYPNKKFYQLAPEKLICADMKKTTIQSVYNALSGEAGEVIDFDDEFRLKAKVSLDNMLKYGG